jgi:hypothetical protein
MIYKGIALDEDMHWDSKLNNILSGASTTEDEDFIELGLHLIDCCSCKAVSVTRQDRNRARRRQASWL